VCALPWLAPAQDKVNADAAVLQDFDHRVADYIKLRKTIKPESQALKPTASPEKIAHHEHELAERILEARSGAAQGDIFTPEIAAEFRRLIDISMQGADAERIRASLRRAEPVRLKALRVNHRYPKNVPLQSTPPSLLLNLPQLPKELDYRLVGRALLLRDTDTSLIVDYILNAIP
jgi:hypothetical protein